MLRKLDYIASLGVNTIWLLPFYPSPGRDDGYDISDYRSISPEYGSIEDFSRLVEAAHSRGIRIIIELVVNHTSDEHPWFQRARRAPEGSIERDYYVWSDTTEKFADTRIIFVDSQTSNWSWDRLLVPIIGIASMLTSRISIFATLQWSMNYWPSCGSGSRRG